MSKIKREKVNYLEFTFNIFDKYDIWQVSFKNPKDGKIIKRTTKLASTASNLIIVKKEIIPSIVEFLTGKIDFRETEEKESTLDDFANKYFEIYINRVREQTYYRSFLYYTNQIKPYFGIRKINSIKPMELEKWQNNFKTKQYKTATIQKYRSILFSIFNEAVKNEIIKVNPLSLVSSPKKERIFISVEEQEDEHPFSKDEIKYMIDNSVGYLRNFILLMYSTGMRPGEIIALTWSDIDFDNKQIMVNKTITNGKVGLPKTASSVRKIDMLPSAEFSLKEQLLETNKYQHVFVSSLNKQFYSHNIIAIRFKDLLKNLNIPRRTLYNLRHSFASQLISNGEDIVWVSKTLGHLDISITLKHYTKFIKVNEKTRLNKIMKIGIKFSEDIL